jgi:hypothetical protein
LKRILSYSLTAATLSVSSLALTAADAASNQLAETTPTARMQHWVADHEALVDAGLGCLKAVLRLTPDQNQLWDAFEKQRATGLRRVAWTTCARCWKTTSAYPPPSVWMRRPAVWLVPPTSSKRSLKPLNRS